MFNVLTKQTSSETSKHEAHYFLLPVGFRVDDKTHLNSRPLTYLKLQEPREQIRHVLSIGAAMSGQGYLTCNVFVEDQWYIASLEYSLEQQAIEQFCFEPIELPARNIRTLISFDSQSVRQLHDAIGDEYDVLIMTFGSESKLFFSSGYHESEIDLFVQYCNNSVKADVDWLVGNQREADTFDDLYSAFRKRAIASPKQTAVISTHLTWNYAELLESVEAFMSHLARYPLSDRPVALYLERDIHQIVAILACQGLGLTVVPIYYDTPSDRVNTQLAIVESQYVITHKEKIEKVDCGAEIINIDTLLKARISSMVLPETPLGLDKANYIYFTSGSEGVPKAVALPGRAIARIVDQPDFLGPMSKQVVSYLANPAFDASALELWGALYNGATLAILDKDQVLDVEVLSSTLQSFGVTVSFFTSGLFNRIADASSSLFETLSYVMFGGEKVSMPHVQRALKQAPSTQFIHCYGPTENGIFTTTHIVEAKIAQHRKDLPIGRPVQGTQIILLNNKKQPVSRGKVGQLVCFGEGVAIEYVGSREQTEKKFVEFQGQRGYLTGDYARISADQELEFIGRVDSQIKLNGFRIELSEIETALSCHSKIMAVYVRMCPVKRQIQAFYVSVNGDEVDDVISTLAHMPNYMQPAILLPVMSIPLNQNGKVDQKALDDIIQRSYACIMDSSCSETMKTVLELFESVLCAPVTSFEKSIFELGGNSLHLMQLLSLLRKTFSYHLELSFLAENSSPKAICDWAELQTWNQTQDETMQEWTF